MDQSYEFRAWFLDNWMRAGIIAAAVMFATLPVLWDSADRVLWLMLTLLPVYMIHQYEDHARGRFVKDFNATIGKGLPVLTRESAMVINVGALWLLYLLAFYLAVHARLGFALIPAYLMTVNGAIHLLVALGTRRYNAGLYTACALFMPWGAFLTVYISEHADSALVFNILGPTMALAIHAGIVVYALRRRKELQATTAVEAAASS